MEILATNVSDALAQGLRAIVENGEIEGSRNGPVIVFPTSVTTTYLCPMQRVLFSPVRNANPFFHLMESLWMLAGRQDLEFPLQFNSRFHEYSDDGHTLAGAYGFRWRKYFGRDQLGLAISELRRDPSTRRVVIAMWSPNDLAGTGKDLPCNTQIYLDCRHNKLNMTVCNRSNDILWGAYGANAVHFSILQEYIATAVGFPVGVYRQFSNNLHLYLNVLSKEQALVMAEDVDATDMYAEGIKCEPMIREPGDWNSDLGNFMRDPMKKRKYVEPFFSETAVPMYEAWALKDEGVLGLNIAKDISAQDWRLACVEWIERRRARRKNE